MYSYQMCYCNITVTLWCNVQSDAVDLISVLCLSDGSSCGEIELEENRLRCGDVRHGELLSVRQAQFCIQRNNILCFHHEFNRSKVTSDRLGMTDVGTSYSPFKVLQRFGLVRSSMDLTDWNKIAIMVQSQFVTKRGWPDTVCYSERWNTFSLPADTASCSSPPESSW